MEWNGRAKIGWQASPQLYGSHRMSGAVNVKDVACINTPVTDSSTVVFKISENGTFYIITSSTIMYRGMRNDTTQ